MTSQEITKLVKAMHKLGATSVKIDGFEVVFGNVASVPSWTSAPTAAPTETLTFSDQEMLKKFVKTDYSEGLTDAELFGSA